MRTQFAAELVVWSSTSARIHTLRNPESLGFLVAHASVFTWSCLPWRRSTSFQLWLCWRESISSKLSKSIGTWSFFTSAFLSAMERSPNLTARFERLLLKRRSWTWSDLPRQTTYGMTFNLTSRTSLDLSAMAWQQSMQSQCQSRV